jgi:hypothetical protein
MEKWGYISKHLNLGTSFVSRKLYLPGTTPGTHSRWRAGRDKKKKAESPHLPGIKPHSPAIQSVIQSLYWPSYQGSYTRCASHNTIGNMLICNNRILKFAIWYVQSVFLLRRTLPHRLQLSGTFARSLTKTTKLSLFAAFRLMNIRVSGDFWDTRYILTDTKPLHLQSEHETTFNPSKYQVNRLFQVVGDVTLSTR